MNDQKAFADYFSDDEDMKDEMDLKHVHPKQWAANQHNMALAYEGEILLDEDIEKIHGEKAQQKLAKALTTTTKKRKLKCECGLPSCKTCKERAKKQRKRARIAIAAMKVVLEEKEKEEKKETKEDKKEAKIQNLSEGDHKIKSWGEHGEQTWTTASALKKMDEKEQKNSAWACTVYNNETGTEMRQRAKDALKNHGLFTAYQWEVCPTTGKHHHQIFVWGDKPRWRSEIMNAVAGMPFFYCRKQYSCKSKALAYVSKDTEKQLVAGEDNQWFEGDWDSVPESANKKKSELLRKRIRAGHIKTLKDVWQDDELGTMILTAGSRVTQALEIEKTIKLDEQRVERGLPPIDLETPRSGPISVLVLVGVPGAGKTIAGMEHLGATYDEEGEKFTNHEHIYEIFATNRGKHNSYKGETEGAIHDFDGSEEMMPLSTMKAILEGHAFKFDTHAIGGATGSVQCKITKWVITSNLAPREWYPKAHPGNKKALLRRLQNVKYFTKPHPKLKNAVPVYEIDGIEVDHDPADDFIRLREKEQTKILDNPNFPMN